MHRLGGLLATVAVLAAVWIHVSGPVKDPDGFWHLATGKWIVEQRALPGSDPFGFAPSAVQPAPDDLPRARFILRSYWLAQSAFYLVYRAHGDAGLVVLRASVLTLAVLALMLWMRRLRAPQSLTLLFPLLTGLYLSNAPFDGIRPQMFSILAVVLLVFLLEETIAGRSPRATAVGLPALMLIWSNLHGGVVLGLVIVLIYLGAETGDLLRGRNLSADTSRKGYGRFLTVCGLTLGAALLNPETYHSILYVVNLGTESRYGEFLTEYLSPLDMALDFGQVLYTFWLYLFLGAVVHVACRRRIPLRRHLVFLFLVMIALESYRYSVFLILIEPAILGAALAGPLHRAAARLPRRLRHEAIVPAIFVAIGTVFAAGDVDRGHVLEFRRDVAFGYPTGAVRFIESNDIHGKAFNSYDWGGYLIWELYPQVRVLHDGRGLVERLFLETREVLVAAEGKRSGRPRWKELLDNWGADIVLIRGADTFVTRIHPLVPALTVDPDWALVYRGFDAMMFLRREEHRALVQQHRLPGHLAFDQIAAQARMAIDERPGRREPWVVLAQALLYRGKREESLKAYRRAYAINSSDEYVGSMIEMLERALAIR